MNKIHWVSIFFVVLLGAPLHAMQWLPNMSNVIEQRVMQCIYDNPFMRRIAAARNFCQEYRLPIVTAFTGVAVTLIAHNYNKPFIHAVGVLGFGSLLMYKYVQLKRRVDGLSATMEEKNQSIFAWQKSQEVQQEECRVKQEELSEKLNRVLLVINDMPNRIAQCEQAFEEKFKALNNETLLKLQSDIVTVKGLIDEIKSSAAAQAEMLTTIDSNVQGLGSNIKELSPLLDDLKHNFEKTGIELKEELDRRDKILEEKIAHLDKLFQGSLDKIKTALSKKPTENSFGIIAGVIKSTTKFTNNSPLIAEGESNHAAMLTSLSQASYQLLPNRALPDSVFK